MPHRAYAFRLAVGLLLAGLVFAAHAARLPPTFTAALADAGIPLDRVAVVVQPVGASHPVLAHNANAALNPGSVMKLVTSFAALAQLGPAYTWTTDVWIDGPVADGVLDGNLVIKGHGDPTLTLERLWLLQRELRLRGIRHVRGHLVLDTSHFDVPAVDPGAFDGEPYALYNASPGPLVANFSAITLRVLPDGDAVRVAPELPLADASFDSDVVLADAPGCNGWKDALVATRVDPMRATWRVSGSYPRGCGEQAWTLAPLDATAAFDATFRGLWRDGGGTLAGTTVAGVAPASPPLLRFASEPLAAALVRLNKHSNNVMTRNLFLTLGAEAEGAPATLDKGVRAVAAAFAAQGVPREKLVLENGAGLSRIERVSAASLTRMLQVAARRPWAAEFEAALPVVAVDGTLRRRFADSPVAGHAHLKTGTLRDVSALAGYVYTAAGERLSFVMLVNHANARQSEAAQRALLEWVHAGAGARRMRR